MNITVAENGRFRRRETLGGRIPLRKREFRENRNSQIRLNSSFPVVASHMLQQRRCSTESVSRHVYDVSEVDDTSGGCLLGAFDVTISVERDHIS